MDSLFSVKKKKNTETPKPQQNLNFNKNPSANNQNNNNQANLNQTPNKNLQQPRPTHHGHQGKSFSAGEIDFSPITPYLMSAEVMEKSTEVQQVKSWDEIFVDVSNKIQNLQESGEMVEIDTKRMKQEFKI